MHGGRDRLAQREAPPGEQAERRCRARARGRSAAPPGRSSSRAAGGEPACGASRSAASAAVVSPRGRWASSSDVLRSTSTPMSGGRSSSRSATRMRPSASVSRAAQLRDVATVGGDGSWQATSTPSALARASTSTQRSPAATAALNDGQRVLPGAAPGAAVPAQHRDVDEDPCAHSHGVACQPMAPRLSFVLVAHREQAFLEPCLASILGQDVADLEVVAIDDASDDHVPELLDAIAARDPRVRVEHLPQRVGRGAARNRGLELARGEHVWFIRTTDLVADGARRGRARGRPTTSCCCRRSARARWAGARPAPRQTGLERRLAGRSSTRSSGASCSAAFGAAGFDELTAIWPALLAAQRIAVRDEPAYVRREPPNAVATRHAAGTRWTSTRRSATAGRSCARRSGATACALAPRAATAPTGGGSCAASEQLSGARRARRAREAARTRARDGRRARLAGARGAACAVATDRDPLRRHYRAARSACRWTRTSPSSPPTGTAATPATRARSTSARASSCPACAASGSSSEGGDACPTGVEHVVAGHRGTTT